MNRTSQPERVETVIIGGGQAGLATAYQLRRRDRPAVVLDASARVGDAWRARWDSLRLFTPSTLSHLPGMRAPGPRWGFLTKDAFADYLAAYAERFNLDVRSGARVDAITPRGDSYIVTAGERRFEADHVVLATGAYQEPKLPVFAPELDPRIVQLHSSGYRNPGQLRDGGVLIVGAGNSGAEIAIELSAMREITLAGRGTPVFPVRPTSPAARLVMPAFLFLATRLLTTKTPIGRRVRERAHTQGSPLIRVKPRDLARAGVRRVGRVTGVRDGRPALDDGTVLDVANVIWCTGFRPDFSWIDMAAFAGGEMPAHARGVLTEAPGMYLVGSPFQYALASSFIGGVGRDADYIAGVIAARARERARRAADGPAAEPVGTARSVGG